MICGTDLWKNKLASDMETVSFHGISYSIFKNEPATLYCALAESARKYPDHTALVSPEKQSYTFEKFLEMTDSFAACLEQKWNITKGCVVGLLHYNSVEFCTALLALNKLGAITVPLPGKFRQQEILSLIEKAEISFLICHEDYADWFSGDSRLSGRILVFPENQADSFFLTEGVKTGSALCTDREAPALLMFTSGTTSRSKGVILCNYNFMHAVCSYQKIFHITCCDRTLLAVPIYHITGLAAILGLMLFSGGTVFLHKFFHPEEAAKTMKKERITFFHASPTVFSMLLKEQAKVPDLPDMRLLACGSSNMAPDKIEALHQWMPHMEFRTVYGLTETTSPATIFPEDAATRPYIGSSGIPIPGLSCKIVNDSGEELPPMETGEILLKGPNLLYQYYGTDIPAYKDGWFFTGDLGYINQDGYLSIAGRKKDMINRGGEKICSYDVENVIYTMPQVEEAAIIGVPDEVYGEVAAAAIVLKPGFTLTLQELKAYLSDKLAKYKIPVYLKILPSLPVTPNHKTDKKAIKELFHKEMEV